MESTRGCSLGLRGRSRPVGKSCAVWLLACIVLCLVLSGCADRIKEAQALEQQGNMAGAVSVYEEILAADPDDTEALLGQAVCLFMLGRWDDALVVQERLVALDPKDVQTRIELGFNYLNHQDRPADAARVLGEAARLRPTAKNLTFYAQAQVASGDSVGAEATLREAVATEPEYAYSYRKLFDLLQDEGRTGEAAQLAGQAAEHGVTIETQ